MAGRYIKINGVYMFMSLKAESKTVNEVQTQNHDKRFVCNSDFSQYSVELIVYVDGDSKSGALTVWDDHDLILNNTDVDVDLEDDSVRGVADWFDEFLMDGVNSYLR